MVDIWPPYDAQDYAEMNPCGPDPDDIERGERERHVVTELTEDQRKRLRTILEEAVQLQEDLWDKVKEVENMSGTTIEGLDEIVKDCAVAGGFGPEILSEVEGMMILAMGEDGIEAIVDEE